MTPVYLPVIEPMDEQTAHTDQHAPSTETAPVKITQANHMNFPWSHVLQRLCDSMHWSRWRCVIWLILVFIIIFLNQQLFAWLKPPFDSSHLLKKRQGTASFFGGRYEMMVA